jgi:hypothetical protein
MKRLWILSGIKPPAVAIVRKLIAVKSLVEKPCLYSLG